MQNRFINFCLIFFLLFNITNLLPQEVDHEYSKGELYYKYGYKLANNDFDSSEYYLKLALPLLKKQKNWEYYVDCLNGLSLISYYRGNFESANKYIMLAVNEGEQKLSQNNPYYGAALNNQGIFYRNKGDYLKAINSYRKSILINSQSDSLYHQLAANFQNLGNIYRSKKDLEKSIEYYHRVINLRKKDKQNNYEKFIAESYFSLGNCYEDIKEYNKALSFYSKTLKEYNKFNDDDFVAKNKIILFHSLASIYLNLNKLDSARFYINKSIEYEKHRPLKKHFRPYELRGKIFLEEKKFHDAINNFLKSIQITEIIYNTFKKHPYIARQYYHLANAKRAKGELKNALVHYQEALVKLTFDFEENDFYQNPNVQKIIICKEAFDILQNKANTLYHYYRETNDIKDLTAALETYQLAAELVEKTRQDILTTGSKEQLAGEALAIYEGGMQAAYELFLQTGKPNYLDAAFAFSESNKAILLLESLQEELARNYGGLPDSLREKERDLRIDIAFYERQINEQKQKGEKADAEKIKNWENLLFGFNNEYQDLINLLEEEYPKYYQLKYNTKLATISEIQKKLDRHSALLEYFVGENQIYLFLLTKDKVSLQQLPKKATFRDEINELLASIRNPAQVSQTYETYLTRAHQIYSDLVVPAIDQLSPGIRRLILIPDDALGYLPFEILLRQYPELEEPSFRPSRLDYLLEDYAINYSYSSTLLLNNWDTPERKYTGTFLGFAPSFAKPIAEAVRDCSADQLYSLKCSVREIENIRSLLGGEIVVDEAANLQSFQNQAPGFRILHLATHSCADENNPRFSKIYFAREALSNNDLSTLNLPAELAVLSACNTGSGKLVKGEGVMSLSKGFINAGCPSTLMSLWSVDDCATSDVMLHFYKQLRSELPKDEALQQAKIDYLNQADKARQHPYYWAAFVQMGNFQPMEFSSTRQYWWLGLLALIAGLFFVGIRKA